MLQRETVLLEAGLLDGLNLVFLLVGEVHRLFTAFAHAERKLLVDDAVGGFLFDHLDVV